MIKYRTGGYGNNLIEAVEVVKETEKQVVIETKLTNHTTGKTSIQETRENKINNYSAIHDTWDEAKAYLLEKADKKVQSCRRRLEEAKSHYGNIKGLKQPQ